MKSYFKLNLYLFTIIILVINVKSLMAQTIVHPGSIKKPIGFAISGPLRNNTVVSYTDFKPREIPINRKINSNIPPPKLNKPVSNASITFINETGTLMVNSKL